ncbi:hypothetical protein [Streptomyces sp. NPDC005435]|uniref:hypothetical protein n=1 Tax=Streptomyces sp. NPDC005435 TaxID=3154464 RepID=UPI0034568050
MGQTESSPEQARQEGKGASGTLFDALWGVPIVFALLSALVYIKADNDDWELGRELAWWAYLAGWALVVLTAGWAAATRRKPKWSTALTGVALLVAAGVLQFAANGDAAPWS